MNILKGKAMLAIGAVVDVATQADQAPITGKAMAIRMKLPPRHLQSLLRKLVRQKVLTGARGLNGGYKLARAPSEIFLGEIVRVAYSLNSDEPNLLGANSEIIKNAVFPLMSKLSASFLDILDQTPVDSLLKGGNGVNCGN